VEISNGARALAGATAPVDPEATSGELCQYTTCQKLQRRARLYVSAMKRGGLGRRLWPTGPGDAGGVQSNRILYLDVIRAFAVLAVVVVHLGRPSVTVTAQHLGYSGSWPLLAGGYVGVDVFYVLSGFIITRILLRRETPYLRFLGHRARRLLPALLGLLVVGVPLALLAGQVSAEDLGLSAIFAATMSGPFYLADHGPGLEPFGIAWSLAIEWYFYLLLPLILRRVPRRHLGNFTLAVAAMLFLASACFLSPWWFYFSPPARFSELLIGCWLATRAAPDAAKGRWAAKTILPISAVLVTSWVILGPVESSALYRWVGLPMVVAATAIAIRYGSFAELWLQGHRSCRALAWLGLISYSVYLWHSFFASAISPEAFGGSRAVHVVASVLLAAAFSVASFYLLEKPFLRSRASALTADRAPAGALK
jgi:peptidoglycan/LPS O-acetylase OafA/YrhL